MKITIPEKNREQIGSAIMALIMAIVLLGANVAGQAVYQWLGVEPVVVEDPMMALGTTHFTAIETTGAITGDDVTAVDDVTAGDDVIVTDDLSVADDAVISGITFTPDIRFVESTIAVVTAGSSITPLGTYQPITSASAGLTLSTTFSIQNGTYTGQYLFLINENAAYTITVKDAANTALSGDFTMGPKDSLLMVWDGADWVELAESDN